MKVKSYVTLVTNNNGFWMKEKLMKYPFILWLAIYCRMWIIYHYFGEQWMANFSLGGATRNHLAKIIGKLDPNLRNKMPSTYTLVYLIGSSGLCFPHLCTHSWKIMNTQKPIICINILILKPFLTHSWPNSSLFFFTYVFTFTH
jgi:hypothetical protein